MSLKAPLTCTRSLGHGRRESGVVEPVKVTRDRTAVANPL